MRRLKWTVAMFAAALLAVLLVVVGIHVAMTKQPDRVPYSQVLR